jgi:hypothetical protein
VIIVVLPILTSKVGSTVGTGVGVAVIVIVLMIATPCWFWTYVCTATTAGVGEGVFAGRVVTFGWVHPAINIVEITTSKRNISVVFFIESSPLYIIKIFVV